MSIPGILGEIVARTLADVRERAPRVPVKELEDRGAQRARRRRSLHDALHRSRDEDPVRFLCEVKKASPSRGVLKADLDPRAQADAYREHGASAVSVVTEPHFFAGEEAFLPAARSGAGELPLLRKDFHVHEIQVYEAAAGECDAMLFLASVLSPMQLRDYLQMAEEFGMGHLVEVADLAEAEAACKAGASVVGVNNRDLVSFEVDVGRTERILPALREAGVVSVAESGIHDRATVVRLQNAGVNALLVGEALVTAADPGERLRALRGVS